MGTLCEQCAFSIISRSFLPRIKNALHESFSENQNTCIVFNIFLLIVPFTRYADNIVESDRPQ